MTKADTQMTDDIYSVVGALGNLGDTIESTVTNNPGILDELKNANTSLDMSAIFSVMEGMPKALEERNLEEIQNISNYDAQYGKLAELLNSQQSSGSESDKITSAVLLSYIRHHLLTANIQQQSFSTSDKRNNRDKCGSHNYNSITKTFDVVEGGKYIEGDPSVKFYNDLNTLVQAQFQTNYYQMRRDAELRKRYVEGSTESLQQMSEQQQVTISLLTQMSDYLNEQVGEYSGVYDSLNTLIDTQKRKVGFEADDVQKLSQWGRGCHIVFWCVIAFLVLMVIVEKFEYIARATAA
jgi:hypothetical protein